jgi:hypothetical protein
VNGTRAAKNKGASEFSEPDIVFGQAERAGDSLPVRRGAGLGRQSRNGEFGMAAIMAMRCHPAMDETDGLFQHESAGIGRSGHAAQQQSRANRRVSCKWQFVRRREDAQPRAMLLVCGLQDEYRFGQIEFPRDRLHARLLQTIGIDHDRQRIAAQSRLREDVKGHKS